MRQTTQGVAVFYQSKPDFAGEGGFRYRRVNADEADDRSNAEVAYTITAK